MPSAPTSSADPHPGGRRVPDSRPALSSLVRVGTASLMWLLVTWASWNFIGLNSDGSAFLASIVSAGGFTTYEDDARSYVIALSQIPVVVGLTLGVDNLKWLAILYSFGTLAVPALLLQAALHRAKGDEALLGLVVGSIAVIFMTTCLFSVGEYNTTYALLVLAIVILASKPPRLLFDSAVLVALGLVAVRAYEAMLYLGPVIAAVAIWKMPRPELPQRHGRAGVFLLMAVPAGLSAIGLFGLYLLPAVVLLSMACSIAVARKRPGFADHVVLLTDILAASLFFASSVIAAASPRLSERPSFGLVHLTVELVLDGMRANANPQVGLAIGAIIAAILAAWLGRRFLYLVSALLVLTLACLPLLQLQNMPGRPIGTLHYFSRELGALLLPVIAVLALCKDRLVRAARPSLVTAFLVVIAISPSNFYAAWEWKRTLGDFQRALPPGEGQLTVDEMPSTIRRWFQADPGDMQFLSALGRLVNANGKEVSLKLVQGVEPMPTPGIDRRYVWRN